MPGNRARRRRTRIVAGLHIVRKPIKGSNRFYVYAWRGGPCIHRQDGTYPTITPEILLKQQRAKSERYEAGNESFALIIAGYKQSPEFTRLADSTKSDYRRWLDRIDDRFGSAPLAAFEMRQMRGDIVEWRNIWNEQPRSADMATIVMSLLLNWAVENGLLRINVAANIKKLHKVQRADLIWEKRHWLEMEQAKAPDHLMNALLVGSWTGLRLGDLIKLSWDHVGPQAIVFITNKRKGRAVIPILPSLRAWLEKVPEEERTGMVLRNSRGWSWTESGLKTVFRKKKPQGFDRRIHDLRGTFCTMLITKGLTDDQAAMIMGWKSKRVAEIRARYVDEERVIVSLLDKLTA